MLRFLKLPSKDELTLKYFEKFGEIVEFLDISGLRIRKLPSFIFEKLPKLKWLDLRLENKRKVTTTDEDEEFNFQGQLLG